MSAGTACMLITFMSGLMAGLWAVKGGWEILSGAAIGVALAISLFRNFRLGEDRP